MLTNYPKSLFIGIEGWGRKSATLHLSTIDLTTTNIHINLMLPLTQPFTSQKLLASVHGQQVSGSYQWELSDLMSLHNEGNVNLLS